MGVNGERLGEEVSEMAFNLKPSNDEVAFAYTIAYLMKIHVEALCAGRRDSVVGYTDGAGVVAKFRSGGLRVSEAA